MLLQIHQLNGGGCGVKRKFQLQMANSNDKNIDNEDAFY